jgi:hypothetical protein
MAPLVRGAGPGGASRRCAFRPTAQARRDDLAKSAALARQQRDSQNRTVRTLAREVGLPHTTVHVILRVSDLPPHRIRTFSFSPDPDFEAKLLDIVGLYLNPPENALVICVDEKPGIQALDRTQPLLPLRAHKPRSRTNE